MSRGPLILGTGLLLTVGALTLNSWDTVVNPAARQRALAEIQSGMSYEQIRGITGDEGRYRFLGTGSVKPGHIGLAPTLYEYRWEDAYTAVDVRFMGSGSSQDRAMEVNRQSKDPPDTENLWWARIGLALLALFGFVFLLEGFTTQAKRDNPAAVSSSPSPSP